VNAFLEHYSNWRSFRAPSSLAQKLEMILADTQYLEWVTAQPRGRQRAENILQLLKLARQFDSTRGESLYLFLRYIEEIQDTVGDIEPPGGTGENAVRLMSIHQSKGLEFPVVAVPDLGKPFNFSESKKTFLPDDKYGLCSMVQPENSGQTYPSLPLWLARRQQKLESMGEEMRILYVALTRAENLLLLFGSTSQNRPPDNWSEWAKEKPSSLHLLRTHSVLDWIGSYLWWKAAHWTAETQGEIAHLRYRIYGNEAVEETLPLQQNVRLDQEMVSKLRKELHFSYPFQSATEQIAKTSVTMLRRTLDTESQEAGTVSFTLTTNEDGRERGLAYHKFLELIDLKGTMDLRSIEEQSIALLKNSRISLKELKMLDLTFVAYFFQSDLGKAILSRSAQVRRELPFTVRLESKEVEDLELVDNQFGIPPNEFIVVQGVVDLAVLSPDEIWVVDFKTDLVTGEKLRQIIPKYQQQLNVYGRALQRIYDRPMTRKCLYFLSESHLVEWK
jgi:ATP-dependent helicase/nuclease subunit A